MRVLYVQPGDGFGGTERQAANVIPLLAAHGIDVLPVVGPGEIIVDWLRAAGVTEVLHSPEFPKNRPDARGFEVLRLPQHYLQRRTQVAALVERTIRERQIDLVYAALPFGWVSATESARRCGVPVVWRAGTPKIYAGAFGQALFTMWARRHPPDLMICSSQSVRSRFASMVRAPLEVLLNGIDRERFHPASPLPDARAAVTVGFAARLIDAKGVSDLLEVAARLSRERPQVQFLIAGDGPKRRRYERHAERLGARSNTRFLGYVDDMPSFYRDCDVFVLPSRSEGCSNVLLEAMASGCAVVASDIAGIREVAAHGETAMLVPAGDTAALHGAVRRLVDDPQERWSLAEAARRSVERRFDLSAAVERLATTLHALAAGAHRRSA